MPLKVFSGTVLAVLVTLSTVQADDAQIARQITSQLRQQQMSQNLQGFRIGVQVDRGTVTMMGRVSSSEQGQLALEIARRIPGVRLVVNDLKVEGTSRARRGGPSPALVAPTALQQPTMHQPLMQRAPANTVPVAYAPSQLPTQLASANMGGGYGGGAIGGPMPTTMPSQYGGGFQQAVNDNPSMPGYAWPSYASYPNYGAVSYPKQYSPTAWPYIGPFYPYPQVPLGWRKVMLEWDDGWWWLDFKAK